MAKSVTFNKRENEKKKQQKKAEKQKKKEERKVTGKASSLDDMIAYVDENGMITSTPPDLQQKKEKVDQETIQISVPKREKEEVLVHKGRVEYFSASKGYGFIKDLAGVDKYFFHISNAPANITEGNIVTFDLEKGNKGMNAVNISMATN
ncbi:cold shock domain-containing protein [Bacteroides sp. 519]|uniref:cold shock domain-containing protein n=1 Tax=Bacteroides sp. 519 TaxID=2302937 RepID=UPI0013CF4B7A|nr:cold shock domain-containing protein [Bacteroides sp. 519]NDV60103.1 cold shock domain-containing protein [Bacteroides sp. 519]